MALSDNPKWLSAKYFYDAAGSDLFEQITDLPEYYPTRTELSILHSYAGEMAGYVPLSAALVEFGTGSTKKARILIEATPQLAYYVPVDISAEFLAREAAAVRRDIPWIAVLPVAADFTRDFDLPAPVRSRPSVGFFPARPSAISSRRTRRSSWRRPARILGHGRDDDRRRRPHQGQGRARCRLRRRGGRHGEVQSQCADADESRAWRQFRSVVIPPSRVLSMPGNTASKCIWRA